MELHAEVYVYNVHQKMHEWWWWWGRGWGGGVTVSYTEAFIKHFLSELWTGLLQPPDDNNGGASGHREPLNESDPDKGVER